MCCSIIPLCLLGVIISRGDGGNTGFGVIRAPWSFLSHGDLVWLSRLGPTVNSSCVFGGGRKRLLETTRSALGRRKENATQKRFKRGQNVKLCARTGTRTHTQAQAQAHAHAHAHKHRHKHRHCFVFLQTIILAQESNDS